MTEERARKMIEEMNGKLTPETPYDMARYELVELGDTWIEVAEIQKCGHTHCEDYTIKEFTEGYEYIMSH